MKLKNIFYILMAPAILTTFTSCSDIDENDRWKEADLKVTSRNILIEDFTGQKCINCPRATDVISSLQEQFGHDKIIAVGLHGGPTGISEERAIGLATEEAKAYYEKWSPSSQPLGVINRKSDVLTFDKWATAAAEMLSIEPEISMEIETSFNKDTKQISGRVEALSENTNINGKLQLWITEDNIVGFQKMPDGSTNKEYIHNHVFRSSANGTWGEEVVLEKGKTFNKDFTIDVKDKWKGENIHIVAFIYNDANGVLQVVISK